MSTTEERWAEQRAREQEKLDDMRQRYPTAPERAHKLQLDLWTGVSVKVHCPGEEHCGLWYGTNPGVEGQCGVALEASEVGSEFLEWQVGPRFTPTANPFPIGFTWSGGGEDDPPEIEWWPL